MLPTNGGENRRSEAHIPQTLEPTLLGSGRSEPKNLNGCTDNALHAIERSF